MPYKLVWKSNKKRTVPIYQGIYFSTKESAEKTRKANIGGKKMIAVKTIRKKSKKDIFGHRYSDPRWY